jgi:hypothetical protein
MPLGGCVVRVCLLSAAWFIAPPRVASASPEAAPRAESLFREGKAAFERGDYEIACPQLAESQRLEPAGGTLLALALCYEAWGKNATAWALFQEAEVVARRQRRPDRERVAKQRAALLEPGLSFLTITVESSADESVEVFLDGLRVGEAAYGARTAVDVGAHVVEARHGGEQFFVRTVELAGKEVVSITVPAPPAASGRGGVRENAATPSPASPAPAASAAGPVTAKPPPAASSSDQAGSGSALQRYVPAALLGVGVATLLVGGYFGVRAFRGSSEVESKCPNDPCSASLKSVHESSKSDASLATWLMSAGAVTAGVGTYLILRNPASEPRVSASRHSVSTGPKGVFVGCSGRF